MNPYVYLHEIVRTVPGREEPYTASVLGVRFDPTRHVPGRKVHDALTQLRSAETSGQWPCAVNVWENTWEGLTGSLKRQFQDTERDVNMEDWWNRNLHLRRGGYDRVLVPAPWSPAAGQLRERKIRCDVVLHEVVWLPLGEPRRYLGEFEQHVLPAAARYGVEIIGAFTVAMRPGQVLTLLGAPEWSQLGRFMRAMAEDADLIAWKKYRDLQVARSEDMVMIPVRHDKLAGGTGIH
jgi:hypothetical protein